MPNHTRLTFFQQRALRVYNHTETVRFLNNSKLAKNIKTNAHCDIENQNEILDERHGEVNPYRNEIGWYL